MVKRIVVGAHYGLTDWLAQRITAVVMTVYLAILVGVLLVRPPQQYEGWRALFQGQPMRIFTLVFFVCVFWHAWVGVRDIFMDYIKHTAIRLALEALAILVLVAYTGWAVQILWSL